MELHRTEAAIGELYTGRRQYKYLPSCLRGPDKVGVTAAAVVVVAEQNEAAPREVEQSEARPVGAQEPQEAVVVEIPAGKESILIRDDLSY